MLVRFQNLTSLKMKALDGTLHQVRDLLIDEQTLTAEYVVVDVGGWLNNRQVVIGLDRFGEPDIERSEWPARVLRSEAEGAPEAGDPASNEEARGPATRLSPIGNPVRPTADPHTRSDDDLRSVEFWLRDTDIVAEDGPVGKLSDIVIDTADWRVRHLVVGTGGSRLPTHLRVVPNESIARVTWPGRAIELTCPASRVHESPDLHEVDGFSGKWYNKVLAYYGITR